MNTKQKREKEYKSVSLAEIKISDDEPGSFFGYLSVFNNTDKGDDVMCKGAFTKTIQESKTWASTHNKAFLLPILWMHDKTKPLGGFTEMVEDEVGLRVRGVLDI